MDSEPTVGENLDYLNNFWSPEAGDTVLDPETGSHLSINEIIDGVQVKLSESPEVRFIQDLKWLPTLVRVQDMVRKMGGVLCEDGISFLGSFLRKPEVPSDYADVMRDMIHLSALKSQGDPTLKLFSRT